MKYLDSTQSLLNAFIMMFIMLSSTPAVADRFDRRGGPSFNQQFQKAPVRHVTPAAQKLAYFRPIGQRVSVLPRLHQRFSVGGVLYFYHSGIFYRPTAQGYVVVTAPIGAMLKVLPAGYLTLHIGQAPYYYVNQTYYQWDSQKEAYVVVAEPEGSQQAMADSEEVKTPKVSSSLFIYPKEGQSEDQQSKDRYQCYRWAVEQANFDPGLGNTASSNNQLADYQRATGACLEARGYTVK